MAQTWLQKYSTYEEEVVESATAITAYATGGQANATNLVKKFNRVDICDSDKDSCKLVSGLIGKKQYVFNNTEKILSVYPQPGEYINDIQNNEYLILSKQLVIFESNDSGKWVVYGQQSYKKYVALLSQSGTNDPTGYILDNSIGNIVWTRSGVGAYIGTLTGAFTSLKTVLFISTPNVQGYYFIFYRVSANVVTIETMDDIANWSTSQADSLLSNTQIEIRIYPSNFQFT